MDKSFMGTQSVWLISQSIVRRVEYELFIIAGCQYVVI